MTRAPGFSYSLGIMPTSLRFLAPAFALLAFSSAAEARPFRVNDIPNGSKYGCLNCHGDNKASYNTDFGSDARFYLTGSGDISTLHVDWTPLCPLDSDRDGWTNGEELGDPDCTWKVGDAAPKGILYNPGNPESAPPPVCGSGALEAFEECDGDLFALKDCAEAGAGTGTLGCTADCKFDYSQCSAPPGSTPPPATSSGEDGGCSAGRGQTTTGGAAALGMLFVLAIARSGRRSR